MNPRMIASSGCSGRFLARVNRIDRILAWRTGDTEDRVF